MWKKNNWPSKLCENPYSISDFCILNLFHAYQISILISGDKWSILIRWVTVYNILPLIFHPTSHIPLWSCHLPFFLPFLWLFAAGSGAAAPTTIWPSWISCLVSSVASLIFCLASRKNITSRSCSLKSSISCGD